MLEGTESYGHRCEGEGRGRVKAVRAALLTGT